MLARWQSFIAATDSVFMIFCVETKKESFVEENAALHIFSRPHFLASSTKDTNFCFSGTKLPSA